MTTSVDSEVAGTAGFDGTLSGGTLVLNDTYLTRYAAKQVMISGDGIGATTNVGWIIGYGGASGFSGIYSSTVTPDTTNYVLGVSSAGTTFLNAAAALDVRAANTTKVSIVSTSGAGPSITAGTATTDVNALNITQTWNNAGVTFTAIEANITDTASNAASLLMDLQVGGTSLYSASKAGKFTINSNSAVLQAGQYIDIQTSSFDIFFAPNNNRVAQVHAGEGIAAIGSYSLGFASSATATADVRLFRDAAGILGVRGANTTTGCAVSMIEQTAPSAPSANGVYIYAEDNGSGKTRLMALFNTGAAQQIAIEP